MSHVHTPQQRHLKVRNACKYWNFGTNINHACHAHHIAEENTNEIEESEGEGPLEEQSGDWVTPDEVT